MNKEDLNRKLNEDLNQETSYMNSLTIGKYLLIYLPVLFAMFAVAQFLGNLFFDIPFEWLSILIQAFCFAIFFRLFHKIRHYWNSNWKQ